MLALIHHRASAYQLLHDVRTNLLHLKITRTGLFIEKNDNPFSCKAVLDLLAEIAMAKFEELRLLLSIDCFERQLRMHNHEQKQHRIWLGKQKAMDTKHEVDRISRHHTRSYDRLYLLYHSLLHRYDIQ